MSFDSPYIMVVSSDSETSGKLSSVINTFGYQTIAFEVSEKVEFDHNFDDCLVTIISKKIKSTLIEEIVLQLKKLNSCVPWILTDCESVHQYKNSNFKIEPDFIVTHDCPDSQVLRQAIESMICIHHLKKINEQCNLSLDDCKNYREFKKNCYRERALDLKKGITEKNYLDRMNIISRLSEGIAHDINNPLTFIKGNAQLLRKYFEVILTTANIESKDESLGFLISEIPMMLDEMIVGCERIDETCSRLSTCSKFNEKVTANIVEILRLSIKVVEKFIFNKNIHLTIPNFNTGVIEVIGEETVIADIIINFLLNSIYAVEHNGKIEVSYHFEKIDSVEYEVLTVSDNGCGIPDHIQDVIGLKAVSTKPAEEGTGFGLLTAYHILRKYGGHIKFKSACSEGSSFALYLRKAH